MHDTKLPSGMDEVAGSIEEASAYEQLALERRRGLLGLTTAFALVFLLAWRTMNGAAPTTPTGFVVFAALAAGALGLSAVLRKRPGWEPLFERPRRRSLRFNLLMLGGAALAGALIGALIFQPWFPAALRVASVPALMAGMLFLSQRMAPRRTPTRHSAWAALLAAALLATGLVNPDWWLEVLFVLVATACILESAFRLLAPRRWLVR